MNLKNKKEVTKKKRRPDVIYWVAKFLGAPPALLWIRPKVITLGKTKPTKLKGGVLVISNHQTFHDPITHLCVFWNKKPAFLATKDLFRKKAGNIFFTRMGCIKVDKENFGLSSMRGVINELKAERPVVIFPEGRVNKGKEDLLAFKSGAVLMAHKAGAPILPVYVVKCQKWYHRTVILVGDLIDLKEICGERPGHEELRIASERVRDAEMQLIRAYQDGKLKKSGDVPKLPEKELVDEGVSE